MKKIRLDTPFAAVLFPESTGRSAGPVEVNRAGFGNLMLECEIGFILGEPVKEPLKDVDTLKGKVAFLAAAIELPDLAFTDMKQLKAADINASAISSKGFIMGKPLPLGEAPDINELIPVLSLDGAEVTGCKGSDALGTSGKPALWLVNTMVEHGWTLEKGDVLLTGALGNMLPGKPGSYVYDAGALGAIEVTVK
jgi:2-keto-4-pentenoate hydratase